MSCIYKYDTGFKIYAIFTILTYQGTLGKKA